MLSWKTDPWPLVYFRPQELACKCGALLFDEAAGRALDRLRDRFGAPLVIVSGYRTPEYNRAVGGAPNSFHLRGLAVDVATGGFDAARLAKLVDLARQEGFGGVGLYSTFVHLDRGPRRLWRG